MMVDGTCAGVVALDMETGTLHRIFSRNTILGNVIFLACGNVFLLIIVIQQLVDMAEPISLAPLRIPAPATAAPW